MEMSKLTGGISVIYKCRGSIELNIAVIFSKEILSRIYLL